MEPDFSRYPLHFVCASWRGCLCTPVVALAFSVVLSSRSLGRPAGPGPGGGVFSIALPLSWWWAGSEYKPRKCLHLSLRATCFFLPICAREGAGSGYRLRCPSSSSKRLLFPGGEGRWEPRLCSVRGVFSGFLSTHHLSSEHPAGPLRTIDHFCVYSSPGFHMLTVARPWP